MLDLSRIDAGLPLDLQDCDLVGLADAERDRSAMLAPSVRVMRSGVPSLRVAMDPNRIGQILANVADNARRHTPAGGTIVIDVQSVGSGAELTVTDTGPGVPDDQRAQIFERLVRLDDARDRDRGGAGLGLSIARALARAHGGELNVRPMHLVPASGCGSPSGRRKRDQARCSPKNAKMRRHASSASGSE